MSQLLQKPGQKMFDDLITTCHFLKLSKEITSDNIKWYIVGLQAMIKKHPEKTNSIPGS
jgi:hypothetical protein